MIQPNSLLAEPGPDELFEVIDGERVPKRSGIYENVLAGLLFARLESHVSSRGLGRAVIESLFELSHCENNRRPDVAFVSAARWPLNRRVPGTNAWPVVPELAAEVVSPTDTMMSVLDKVEVYLRAGVSLVWLVLPRQEQLYSYTGNSSVKVFTRDDELTAAPVLPGFRLPIASLFPPPDPAWSGGAW
jgi:Uma2 family endonuclease